MDTNTVSIVFDAETFEPGVVIPVSEFSHSYSSLKVVMQNGLQRADGFQLINSINKNANCLITAMKFPSFYLTVVMAVKSHK